MKKNLAVVTLCLLVGAVAGQVVRDLHLIRSPYEVGLPSVTFVGPSPQAQRPRELEAPVPPQIFYPPIPPPTPSRRVGPNGAPARDVRDKEATGRYRGE